MMGCDPEFMLTMAGKPIRTHTAAAIMEDRAYGIEDEAHGSLGADCGLCELRPMPSKDITKLASNIKHVLKAAAKQPIGAFIFSPLSLEGRGACGGHIHIEAPQGLNTDITRYNTIVRQMFSFYLPLWLADTQDNTATRCKTGYGQYGDVRLDPHGYTDPKTKQWVGSYTIELRTPTAEWLTSPKTMLATFAYVGVVMNEILNHPDKMKEFNDFIFRNKDEFKLVERVAQERNKIFVSPLLSKIKRAVKQMELYKDYKREINWLFDEEKVRAEKEKHEYDILRGWGLRDEKLTLAVLTDPSILKRKLTKAIDSGYEVSPSEYNPHIMNGEAGVAALVHGLNKACIALKWNLKHRYTFYGISEKYGVKGLITADNKYNVLFGAEFIQDDEQKSKTKRALGVIYKKYSRADMRYVIGLPKEFRRKGNIQELIQYIHMLESKLPPESEKIPNEMIQLPLANVQETAKEQERVTERVEITPEYGTSSTQMAF